MSYIVFIFDLKNKMTHENLRGGLGEDFMTSFTLAESFLKFTVTV